MAEHHDYIPTREADFDAWIDNLTKYLKANAVSSGPPPKWTHIPQGKIQELEGINTDWHARYTLTLGPHTSVDIKAKNNAHKRAIAFVRPLVAQFLMFPPVTDEDRVAMALHNHDKTHTPIGARLTRALLSLVKALGGFQLELRFHDENSPHSHAIPYGCKGCMLHYTWGDEKVTDYAQLTKSVLMTNSIYILHLEPEAEGKHFSCALSWVNNRGETGPLSEIYHTIVL